MKRFILWDNDGVLVDTEHWYFTATQQALAELDVLLSCELYQQRMVNAGLEQQQNIDNTVNRLQEVERQIGFAVAQILQAECLDSIY